MSGRRQGGGHGSRELSLESAAERGGGDRERRHRSRDHLDVQHSRREGRSSRDYG